MRKSLFLTAIIVATSSIAQENNELDLFFKLSDYFLKRHVYNGLVNYQYASKNTQEIELLHTKIGEIEIANYPEDTQKAFYVNAYNLLVIYQLSKSYPIGGPLDKSGFFDKTQYTVAGEQLSLNQLESKILKTFNNDPRFHFVLACGAMSCPKLYNLAYRPENINELMDERTKLALNDSDFTITKNDKNELAVSMIFNWYKSDFEQSGDTTFEFINRYRDIKIPLNYKLTYYEYDWTLNERKR